MLFGVDDMHTVVRVMNLTDRQYELHQDQLLGTTFKVEVCGPVSSMLEVGADPVTSPVQGMAIWQVSMADAEHVQCLIENLPAQLTGEQCELATQFIRKNAGVFSRF